MLALSAPTHVAPSSPTPGASLVIRVRRSARQCPFCHDSLLGGVRCQVCDAHHHADCWVEGGGCGSCLRMATPRAQVRRRTPRPRAGPRWRELPGMAVFFFAVFFCFSLPFTYPLVMFLGGAWGVGLGASVAAAGLFTTLTLRAHLRAGGLEGDPAG